uniref:THAP4-like heme-binding beta-barrel domain-containing protein n=1 Tax=Romanomermis culicivorax TaxID=13658 RepID=A0A915ISS3_ROMCU
MQEMASWQIHFMGLVQPGKQMHLYLPSCRGWQTAPFLHGARPPSQGFTASPQLTPVYPALHKHLTLPTPGQESQRFRINLPTVPDKTWIFVIFGDAEQNIACSDWWIKMNLHPAIGKLEWLVGKWTSTNGLCQYPTFSKTLYFKEELEIWPIEGQPCLSFRSSSQDVKSGRVLHQTTGFIQYDPNEHGNSALILAHMNASQGNSFKKPKRTGTSVIYANSMYARIRTLSYIV